MTANVRTVAVLSPGDMGAGIGGVLRLGGLDVMTCLEGRSALTRRRATEADIRDAGSMDELVRSADLVLSVLVPSEAAGTGSLVAAAMRRTGATPVYVDLNAIAPQTVSAIEREIVAAGGTMIDGGIIGGPPKAPGSPTRFYGSGPDTSALEALAAYGLEVRIVGPKIGQASGLKMVYAAGTKGTTALWTELLVASRTLGLEETLLAEFGPNNGTAISQLSGIPTMPRRAKRWIGEMEEIAATFAALGLTPRILEGAADMYRFVGETPLADQTSREPDPTLDQVLKTLSARLRE